MTNVSPYEPTNATATDASVSVSSGIHWGDVVAFIINYGLPCLLFTLYYAVRFNSRWHEDTLGTPEVRDEVLRLAYVFFGSIGYTFMVNRFCVADADSWLDAMLRGVEMGVAIWWVMTLMGLAMFHRARCSWFLIDVIAGVLISGSTAFGAYEVKQALT